MGKAQCFSMQHDTRNAEILDCLDLPSSVRRIAKEWMVERSQMNPKLMSTPCQRPKKDMRRDLPEAFQDLIVRR